jgi:ribosomal protein L34E
MYYVHVHVHIRQVSTACTHTHIPGVPLSTITSTSFVTFHSLSSSARKVRWSMCVCVCEDVCVAETMYGSFETTLLTAKIKLHDTTSHFTTTFYYITLHYTLQLSFTLSHTRTSVWERICSHCEWHGAGLFIFHLQSRRELDFAAERVAQIFGEALCKNACVWEREIMHVRRCEKVCLYAWVSVCMNMCVLGVIIDALWYPRYTTLAMHTHTYAHYILSTTHSTHALIHAYTHTLPRPTHIYSHRYTPGSMLIILLLSH